MHCSGAAKKCVILIVKCVWAEATSLGKVPGVRLLPGALSVSHHFGMREASCPDLKNQCHRVLFSECRRVINCEYI